MIFKCNFGLLTLLLGLCVFIGVPLKAQQEIQVEAISTDQGLSQGFIFDILQDKEGFIWIGTKDGLNRYDGYEFETFTNDPNDPWSISGNAVNDLFEDSAGRIWAASANAGINIYDKKTGRFHHIRHDNDDPASLSGNYISSIVEDSSGYFVVVVADRDINMFLLENDFFRVQKAPQIIRIAVPMAKSEENNMYRVVKGIAKDSKNRIWVGAKDVLYKLNIKKAKLDLAKENISVETVFSNPDGSLWSCGVTTPLFHWDGENSSQFLKDFDGGRVIQVDDQENMWYLRVDSLFGINITGWKNDLDENDGLDRIFYRWKPSNVNDGFPLKSMTLDRSGLIWVGTSGFGLYRINPNQRRFTHQLSGISIRHISVVSAEELFLLSYTNDFWYKQDGRLLGLQLLPDDSSTLDHENMLISKSGDYWIRQGSSGQGDSKLIRHNPQTKTNKIYDISWHHNDFQPMIECQDGAICMAGNNSLITYINPVTNVATSFSLKNGERIINPNEEERIISYENSTALYEDGDGVLWVGTEHGFTKFIRPSSTAQSGKSLQITRYQNIVGDPTSLSYNHVTCFLEDPIRPDRYLWVCTKGGGINRMDKASETFLRYSKKDGLPNNVVYGILADDDGNIWGSTNKGLFCMIANKDVASNKQDYFFRNFSKADGLQENEFNTGAYVKLPDGRLLFGGINGYNVFDPKEILTDSYTPNTFITNILVNNQKVSTGDETGILEHTIETTKSITLTHLQDILTLEFATLDFNAPDQNKYRYQLVGADDTWVEAGNRRSATFLNLQPNDYTFRVQGSNSQGVWSEHIAELQISILPPWWKTWWAYFLYATLILSAIWTYFRFSINRAKLQQQLAFEKREADRVRDLDALKTQLYMNMTHEFRTPLTIILGMAQQVMDNPKEHFNGGMNMIINNSRNLLNLINKMLNLSKLESGKMSLELVQGDVALFLRNLVESFRSYAAKKEILLHFLPEVDSVMMDFDADKLQQVVSNLISNAFKFTPEGGNIYFNLRKENSSLVIRVKDTGRGIPQRDLENVFDRFYQVDNSTTRKHEGSGIGLALSKELVTLMKGTISVQSPPIGSKKGSEFMVVLPIYKEGAIEESDLVKNQLAKPVLMKIENEESVTTVNGAMDESKNTSGTANQQLLEENIKPLILLAEDNEDVAAFVASCLPDDYRLAIAENGQEGLEIAIEIIPDLIISDVMMPVMDGFEFCQKLKSDKRTDHIPVIILTARADMDSKLEGLKLGANAYLPKPFEKNELLLTIKNLFGLRDKLRRHYQNIAGLGEQEEVAVDHSETPKPEDEFVIRVREIIEAHIDDFDFNVQQLAKELHLSHSQFGRKLDALTGYSPSRFIRFARLKKAKDLLQNPDLSITAIAYDCGFNDPSYFTRVFKKEFGKTPNDWRMDAAM